ALALEEGATLLVTRALRDFADLGGGRRRSARRPPPRRIRRVVDHLHQREAATDLDALAAVAGLSKFHFIRHFAAEIGMTPAAYLRTLRISEAARELRRGASIEAAAAGAGFTNMTSFGRAFRSIVGTTPRRYARDAGGGPRLG
ncbi:MAG: helix-turn-helix domain-containing protein, partial [Myxococcales bacterium]|nr:helix-turn-helix domain-containing protein [Myxococcales bacterium]